ncbi:uncharacterized protein BO97DRAFT_14371 [Aspergillus homomorphus CBS 101889]|uniref:Uncharacterized protein n=1 Tax=Aspergillus homomorphus (strain CBS 101889) TaxID=1450537 RepID=A0A395IC36_ASPHC|nr:hypothetical protein BO97DRAFT_14371 [Aspergillus homomorphus CBS 101889]RAL17770.1 hypothetical protein BO97DRAFT_14371 [Aspergillus homomorphus CBS 101889]
MHLLSLPILLLLLSITTPTKACTPPPDPSPEYLTTRPTCTTPSTCAAENEYCFREASPRKCLPRLQQGTCCALDEECTSNFCAAGSCAITQTGKNCTSVSDCVNPSSSAGVGERWICAAETNTCLPGVLGVGAACVVDAQCGFGVCEVGFCGRPRGEYGDSCQTTEQCREGLACVYSLWSADPLMKLCQEVPSVGAYGAPCARDEDCVSRNCGVNGERVCGDVRVCKEGGESCWSDADCCRGGCRFGRLWVWRTCEV